MVNKIKPLGLAIATLLLASCAGQAVVKEPVQASKPAKNKHPECETLVRNLTLPWRSPQDTCMDDRSVDHSIEDSEASKNEQELAEIMERNAYLSQKRKEREREAVIIKATEIMDTETVSIMSEDSAQVQAIQSHAGDHLTSGQIIWFAKHVRILGPQGGEKALQLLPQISGNDNHITLRGYFMDDEIGEYDPEVFSVARALAVKKKLVEEGNISPDRITILHHLPDVTGRYVRVSING